MVLRLKGVSLAFLSLTFFICPMGLMNLHPASQGSPFLMGGSAEGHSSASAMQ